MHEMAQNCNSTLTNWSKIGQNLILWPHFGPKNDQNWIFQPNSGP